MPASTVTIEQPGGQARPASGALAAGGALAPAPVFAAAENTIFHRIGFLVLLVALTAVFSRFNEFLRIPKLVMVTISACFAASVFTGGAFRAVSSAPGLRFMGVTLLMCCSVPFSVWRGGSFELLTEEWVTSLLVFVVVSGTITSIDQCRRAMHAMAAASLIIVAAGFRYGAVLQDRLSLRSGTLGNPNDFAAYLIMGLPFCVFVFLTRKRLSVMRVASFLGAGAILVLSLRTGSRGGMLTLAALLLITFWKLSLANKFKLLMAALIVIPAILPMVPNSLIERLGTYGWDSTANFEENRQISMAATSYYARRQLLENAVLLTLRHPFLGVGPGMFQVAASRVSQEEGERAYWHETHNMYVQVSSECGIPAFLLYLSILVWCLRTANAVRRRVAAYPELNWLSTMALCLYMGVAVYCGLGLFASLAYGTLLPLFAALTEAMDRTTRQSPASALPAASIPAESASGDDRLGIATRLRRRLLAGS